MIALKKRESDLISKQKDRLTDIDIYTHFYTYTDPKNNRKPDFLESK